MMRSTETKACPLPVAAPANPPRETVVAGIGFALTNITISALQPVITRYGALRIDPLLFCAGSATVAAVCAAVMLACTGEIRLLWGRPYLIRLFFISMTGTVATTLALIYGLRRLDAIAGVILLESEPIYSLLLSTIFLRERPALRQLLATLLILTAIGLVLGTGQSFRPLYAAGLILFTPLCWQTSHVLSLRIMPPLSPRVITAARYVYAAIVLGIALVVFDRDAAAEVTNSAVMIPIAFTGAFVYFMGSFTWYGAISRLSLAWTTTLVIPAVPIVSLLLAIVFLGERPSVHELVGIAIAVIGILALVVGTDARRNIIPAPASYD